MTNELKSLTKLDYGTHLINNPEYLEQEILVISAHDFSGLISSLSNLPEDQEGIILTPETITEVDNGVISIDKPTIEARIDQVTRLSIQKPGLEILLSTAFWQDEMAYSTVLLIKNGIARPVSQKTHLLRSKEDHFQPSLADKQDLPGYKGVRVLICKDLVIAGAKPGLLELKGTPQLIALDTQVLLVCSCFGIGSNLITFDNIQKNLVGSQSVQDYANDFYRTSLEFAIGNAFKQNDSLQMIVVCDRVPNGVKLNPQELVSSKPLSGVFYRQDITES